MTEAAAVVIADASPLNYLVLIGEIEVLPKLYGRVIVPAPVWAELRDAKAPASVAQWVAALPAWAEVRPVGSPANTAAAVIDASLEKLGNGERAAILLAQEQAQTTQQPVLLLLDEWAGRQEAERRQISVIGTLGVLRLAALRGWVDLPACFARLRQTNFRAPQGLMAELLAEDAARRSGGG